jgi:hypothetical protein
MKTLAITVVAFMFAYNANAQQPTKPSKSKSDTTRMRKPTNVVPRDTVRALDGNNNMPRNNNGTPGVTGVVPKNNE